MVIGYWNRLINEFDDDDIPDFGLHVPTTCGPWSFANDSYEYEPTLADLYAAREVDGLSMAVRLLQRNENRNSASHGSFITSDVSNLGGSFDDVFVDIFDELHQKHNDLHRDHDDLHRDHDDLHQKHNDLHRDHDDLRRDHDDLRQDYEPRIAFELHENFAQIQKKSRQQFYEKNGLMPQWAVVRELRNKFSEQNCRFERYVRGVEAIGSMRQFARRCNWQSSLRPGITTFKEIVQGRPPTTLSAVFAFISLSYAMHAVMADWGIQMEFSPTVNDFFLWSQSISIESERNTFNHIVAGWFTKLGLSLAEEPVQKDPPQSEQEAISRILKILSKWDAPDNINPQESMKNVIMKLINAGSVHEAFNFSAFLNVGRDSNMDQTCTQRLVPQSMQHISSHYRNESFLPKDPDPDLKCDRVALLQGSAIYIRAKIFMIYVSQFGLILIYLGDENRFHQYLVKDNQIVTVGDVVEAAEVMKTSLVDPMIDDASCPESCRDLCRAMREVLDLGLVLDQLDLWKYFTATAAAANDVATLRYLCLQRRNIDLFDGSNLLSVTTRKRSTNPSLGPLSKRRHYSVNNTEPNTCDVCEKSFPHGKIGRNNLVRHKREQHSRKVWTCPSEECPRTFTRRNNLADHFARIHPEMTLSTTLRSTHGASNRA